MLKKNNPPFVKGGRKKKERRQSTVPENYMYFRNSSKLLFVSNI